MTPGGEKVRTGKAPPHNGCRELGIVMGSGGGGGYTSSEHKMESAQNEIRNRAAEIGGDFVAFDTANSDLVGFTLSGRAFDCSAGPPPQTPVPVVVQTSGAEAERPVASVEDRLRSLDDLHQKGLITEDERNRRREEILQGI